MCTTPQRKRSPALTHAHFAFTSIVMAAEIVKYYRPKLVELHNYSGANSSSKKKYNWKTLRKKVLPRIRLKMNDGEVDDIVKMKSGAIENFLVRVKNRLEKSPKERRGSEGGSIAFGSAPQRRESKGALETRIDASALQREVDTEILIEKEQTICDLRETVDILEQKVQKLELLLRLKDTKIGTLTEKLERAGAL